jgi:hypothetical protein
VGARLVGVSPRGPVVRQPRVRHAAGQLPRLGGVRQELPQRRQPSSGAPRCRTISPTR